MDKERNNSVIFCISILNCINGPIIELSQHNKFANHIYHHYDRGSVFISVDSCCRPSEIICVRSKMPKNYILLNNKLPLLPLAIN